MRVPGTCCISLAARSPNWVSTVGSLPWITNWISAPPRPMDATWVALAVICAPGIIAVSLFKASIIWNTLRLRWETGFRLTLMLAVLVVAVVDRLLPPPLPATL